MLDSQIGDAPFGSQVVCLVQGVCGAGVDAQTARAAVLLKRTVEVEVNVGEHGAQKDIRADRRQQVGVLASEAKAGPDRGVAFDERPAIDKDARLDVA